MNIIEILTRKFFFKELFRTLLIIIISCILSLLKINVISLITANIIKSKNPNIYFSEDNVIKLEIKGNKYISI